MGSSERIISIFEGGLHATSQNQTTSDKASSHKERIYICQQEQLPEGDIVFPPSLAFYNQLSLVPKTNNKWQPILDLSVLNKSLKVKTFKMETPKSIRLLSAKGVGVVS